MCDRWDLGKVLVYSTSMDVNSCFLASMLADLHNGVGTLNAETPIYSFAISAGKAHPHPDFICLIHKLGTCLTHTTLAIIPSRFFLEKFEYRKKLTIWMMMSNP